MTKQTFTTGQVLTASQMTSLQQTAMGGGSTTAKTASYVLVAADAGTVVQMNAAGATTITVNTALFAAGDSVQIQNVGAGVCTVTAGTATVSTAGSLALSQYEGGQLYFNTTSAALFFDIVQSSGMTNPMTTTGDIIYSSSGSTPARLGIGTTGQVVTVASGLPSWATPAAAASGYTQITSSSFTSVATVTVDSVFTSTYKRYQVFLRYIFVTTGGSLQWQYRYGSTTENSGNYFGSAFRQNRSNTKTDYGFASTTFATLDTGGATNANSMLLMTLDQVGNSNQIPYAFQQGLSSDSQAIMQSSMYVSVNRTFTGFILTPSAGTLTGEYAVYGLAN